MAFRDADNCTGLLNALAALDEQKTSATEADADRYRRGECRKMIRRDHLCNMCIGRSGSAEDNGPAEVPRGKGKGKKWK
jgi:hypothetical protein